MEIRVILTFIKRILKASGLFLCFPAFAQSPALPPGVHQIHKVLQDRQQTMPLEKLYLHFDRPVFAAGDIC
jgi:hypothetical protein